MRTLAERVASLVARAPGSLKEFEAEHNIANGTLAKIANGKTTRPAPQTLQRIAAAFGVTVAWLVGEEPTATPAPDRAYHPEDRYPTREQAIALLRGIVPDQVLDAVKLHALKSPEDPGIDFWLNEIRTLARHRADMAKHVDVQPEETAPRHRR